MCCELLQRADDAVLPKSASRRRSEKTTLPVEPETNSPTAAAARSLAEDTSAQPTTPAGRSSGRGELFPAGGVSSEPPRQLRSTYDVRPA